MTPLRQRVARDTRRANPLVPRERLRLLFSVHPFSPVLDERYGYVVPASSLPCYTCVAQLGPVSYSLDDMFSADSWSRRHFESNRNM